MFEVAMLTVLFGLVVWSMVASGAAAKNFAAAENPRKKPPLP